MSCDDFVNLRLANAERHIARELRREKVRRELTDTVDALTLPAPCDVPVLRLPPVRDVRARVELRDALSAVADKFDADELRVMLLFLRGHSPRAIFSALCIPTASGYRRFGAMFAQLREVAND